MQSAWGSPAGDVMRALCFMPNTLVKLKNGKIVQMQDLNLGDVLLNGFACLCYYANKEFYRYKSFNDNRK